MIKKDLITIFLAIFLIGAVLLIGAKGDLIKNKLGINQKENSKLNQEEETIQSRLLEPAKSETEIIKKNYSTSSENILVSAPQPDEIIKGTVFEIRGQTRGVGTINIKIFASGEKEQKSGEIWLATTTKVQGTEEFTDFKIRVDVKPHSGWAGLEISSQDSGTIDLISFPIKISASL